MQQTTNYALKKIELTDSPPDITVINPNWEIIDAELKKLSVSSSESATAEQLAALESKIGSLTNLTTTQKTNLVAAINEIKQSLTNHSAEDASSIKKGHVQLSDATNSTSTILAATANAVKKVWDMATLKYTKPAAGIPKVDLDSTVQASLGKADSALQSVPIATQAEAEAGTSDAKYMTPLKVKQAITKLVPKDVPNGYAGLDSNGKILESSIPNGYGVTTQYDSMNLVGLVIPAKSQYTRKMKINGELQNFIFRFERTSTEIRVQETSRQGALDDKVYRYIAHSSAAGASMNVNKLLFTAGQAFNFYSPASCVLICYYDEIPNEIVVVIDNPSTVAATIATYGRYTLEALVK